MHALFSYTYFKGTRIVSQQSELCIFRCVASAAHFLFIGGKNNRRDTTFLRKEGEIRKLFMTLWVFKNFKFTKGKLIMQKIKGNLKKVLSYALAFTMASSVLTGANFNVIASSEDVTSGSCGDYVTWNLDVDTGVLTITGTGAIMDYVLDETGTESSSPFDDFGIRHQIKSVVIGEGITRIGDNAFNNVYHFTNISLPSTLESIGNKAFCDCSDLKTLTLPANLTTIEENAFYYCQDLESIISEPSDKVLEIQSDAFHYCGSAIDSLTVTADRELYFSGITTFFASKLTSFKADKLTVNPNAVDFSEDEYGNKSYSGHFSSCWDLTDFEVGNEDVLTISAGMFKNCRKLEKLTLKPNATIDLVGAEGFSYCHALTEVPPFKYGMTTIPAGSFQQCYKLKAIDIPDSVTTIEKSAFSSCSSLNDVTIPSSVTTIGKHAFLGLNDTGDEHTHGIERKFYLEFDSVTSPTRTLGTCAFSVECDEIIESGGCSYDFTPRASDYPLKIYVSDKSAFESAEGWSVYANNYVETGASDEEEEEPVTPEKPVDTTKFSTEDGSSVIPEDTIVTQKTAVDNGVYRQRFVKKVSKSSLTGASEITFKISNGTSTAEYTTNKVYENLSVNGEAVYAGDGYVYITLTIKDIPDVKTITIESIEIK